MSRLAHRLVAAFLAPGHVRVRDHVAAWLTFHVPAIYRLRARWASRNERPGWRPSDYR